MTCSTMTAGWTDQTRAVIWNLKVSSGELFFRSSPNFHYVCVPTTEEVKQKIISIIRNLPLKGQNVLVQFWAAKKIGKTCILTTTCQPFGLYGINEELEVYRKGLLHHKLYVYVHHEKGVAVGIPGLAFLNCTSEQTQNVHNILKDHRPPCEDAIFSRVWGSFAVPVIVDGQCLGVLDFVMDTSEKSYDSRIREVCRLLQHAGFQSSFKTDCPRRTCININSRKRVRRTRSFSHTYYCRLVPLLGLSSAVAAEKLRLTKGTFRNACRNVGIPEWPGLPSTCTRAFSLPETPVSPTASESSSIGTPFGDSISSRDDEGISERSREQTLTPITSSSENQIVPNTSPVVDDDLNYYWDQGVSEGSLEELITISNTSTPETEIKQIAYDTSYTEALLESGRDEIGYQGNETTVIEELDHQTFMERVVCMFEDAPVMLLGQYENDLGNATRPEFSIQC